VNGVAYANNVDVLMGIVKPYSPTQHLPILW